MAVAILLTAVLLTGGAVVAGGVVVRRARRRRSARWTSAGGLVLDRRGRIALVRQRDRRGRWRWTLPKGRIDPGETAETAALREVHEESGLRARIVRPLALHEGRLHDTAFFEMALVRNDGVHERQTVEVRMVSLARAVKLVRSERDLAVLRRLLEMHTRIVPADPEDSGG
jgi:8-oxo-dGTP pyrophosphatase MutT (NUDIX family)